MGIRSAYSRYKNRIVRNVLVGTIGTLFVMGIGYTTYRIVPALVPEPKFDLPDWIGMERRTYEKKWIGRAVIHGHDTVSVRMFYKGDGPEALPVEIHGVSTARAVQSIQGMIARTSGFDLYERFGKTYVFTDSGMVIFSPTEFHYYRAIDK